MTCKICCFTGTLMLFDENNQRFPMIGEMVYFKPNPDDTVAKSNYNDGYIPAIVTRVWSYGCINLKIIPDQGPMQDRSSVTHNTLNPAGYHFLFRDEYIKTLGEFSTAVGNGISYFNPENNTDVLSLLSHFGVSSAVLNTNSTSGTYIITGDPNTTITCRSNLKNDEHIAPDANS